MMTSFLSVKWSPNQSHCKNLTPSSWIDIQNGAWLHQWTLCYPSRCDICCWVHSYERSLSQWAESQLHNSFFRVSIKPHYFYNAKYLSFVSWKYDTKIEGRRWLFHYSMILNKTTLVYHYDNIVNPSMLDVWFKITSENVLVRCDLNTYKCFTFFPSGNFLLL